MKILGFTKKEWGKIQRHIADVEFPLASFKHPFTHSFKHVLIHHTLCSVFILSRLSQCHIDAYNTYIHRAIFCNIL